MLTRRHFTASLLATPCVVKAQSSKTIRIIVPYPAGGPTDAVGRIVAAQLGLALNQSVIVENIAGASGSLGVRQVAKADADGSVLLLGNNQTLGTNPYLVKDLGYDVLNDFTPILGLCDLQQALIVKKALPVNTLAEFLALAKDKGDKLNYGSTGIGSGSHLAMELFKIATGISPLHIPYKGAAQLANDLLGGVIDVSIATLASVLGQVQAGELKCLGIASAQRAPQLPAIARLNEQGVQGAESDSWLCFHAPAKTPKDLVEKMSTLLMVELKKPTQQEAMLKVGAVPSLRTPAEFRLYHEKELKKWGEVIKAAKVEMN
jgi:tripartite-type tricarboxylate transporter receptor subunit TctC